MSFDDVAVETTPIDGLLVFRVKQVEDPRGTVREFYRASVWQHDDLRSRVDGPWAQGGR